MFTVHFTCLLCELRDFGVVLSYLHWTGERIVLAADRAADFPKVEKFRTLADAKSGDLLRFGQFLRPDHY